ILFPLFSAAQPCRYQIRLFSSFTKTANVIYGNAPAINAPYLLESSTTNQNLLLELFEPVGDTAQKRALIIFAHSGGFLNGTRNNEDMLALCDSFVHRGYVTATLEYRLGFNPLSSNASERAVWRGIQDASAAVRFFKQNATLYKIDTNRIFLMGSSAGAFITLGLPFIDDSERPASTYSGTFRPNLGCKDCAGNSYLHSSKIAGAISCWGATGDTAWFKNNNNTPVQLFHGDADATVPFTEGYPFGLPTISYVRGSQQINEQLNRTSIYHEFYPVAGLGHEYWGTSNGTFIPAGPTMYWQEIIFRATDFMLGRMTGLPTCVLPVTLSGFSGNVSRDIVQLRWTTASELNLNYIIIERSIDGRSFRELTRVDGKGTNGNGATYLSSDDHPYAGDNYYRLKLVDQNGQFSYSGIIRIRAEEKELLITRLYPNPVIDFLQVEIQSAKNQDIMISLIDYSGKRLQVTEVNLTQGLNNHSLSFDKIAAGLYLVQFTSKLDGRSVALKVIRH
ncbi:MAG: T9SS type A sorting domain-containing protein, partial [Ferruginibacter sp.]